MAWVGECQINGGNSLLSARDHGTKFDLGSAVASAAECGMARQGKALEPRGCNRSGIQVAPSNLLKI
jgi:hypothetical protein